MATLGELLRANRKEKNISLDALEDALKISKKTIEALEHDQIDPALPPVYVRGFILSYCKYVGIDKNEVLALYKPSQKQPEKFIEAVEGMGAREKVKVVTLIVLVFVIVAFVCFMSYLAITTLLKETAPTVSPPAKVSEPDPSLGDKPLTTELQRPSQPPTGQVPENTGQTTTPAEHIAAVEQKAPLQQPSVTPLRVQVTSTSKSWMEVTIDNGTPFEIMQFAGDTVFWEAAKHVVLKLGNAGGVSLEVNGIKLKPFGKPNEVVSLRFENNTVSMNQGQPQALDAWRATGH